MNAFIIAIGVIIYNHCEAKMLPYALNPPGPLQLVPLPNVVLPLPTPQQLAYGGQISALIHFGMATFFHDGDPGCDANNWNGYFEFTLLGTNN